MIQRFRFPCWSWCSNALTLVLQRHLLQKHVEDESLFGALASSEEANESLLKFELFLFQQVVILKDDLKDLLA